MTNISVFGEDKENQTKKPIEFVYCLTSNGSHEPDYEPNEYDEIMLLGQNSHLDLIIAWRNDGGYSKAIYLGHWNDGIVE